MNNDTSAPAFPVSAEQNGVNYGDCGMSMRDYFAAKAMSGLLATSATFPDHGFSPISGFTICENIALFAYRTADAMLKMRDL